jgi:hypothetical protein
MDRMIGQVPAGADTPELRAVMSALAKDPKEPELTRLLQEMARIRGKPYAEIRAQYDKFLKVREQAAQAALKNGEPIPPLSDLFHGDFMASTPQLRYGQVVGDAFGIDPVFGALLNPTGGMVGPGNLAIAPGATDALGYHGLFHDAAGYLYNYHGVGPGYNYLGAETGDTGNPLTGQVAGAYYWTAKVNPDALPMMMAGHALISSSPATAGMLNWLFGSQMF